MNKKARIKLIVVLIALFLLLTFMTSAQFQIPEAQLKIIGPITNNGPVDINLEITFNAKCEGTNTKLILCRDNSICNSNTQSQDIICSSTFSNNIEKTCFYATTQYDEGIHDNDIATCCDNSGVCDTNSLKIENWVVNPLQFQIPTTPSNETLGNKTEVKIESPVTNNGPVQVVSNILFTGKCLGENVKLVICKENSICNYQTEQPDLICESDITNEVVKNCEYKTTFFDLGVNDNDIATCCNDIECDTSTISIEPWIVYESTQNITNETFQLPKIEKEVFDNVTLPKAPSIKAKKEKTIDEILSEGNINIRKEKIKEIKRHGFSAEEITVDGNEKKTLVIHQPIFDGGTFENTVPLDDKDGFTFSSIFDGTAIEIEFDSQEIKQDSIGRNFSKGKINSGDSWKISYSHLLPSLEFKQRFRISSSSPIYIIDDYNGKLKTGEFILDYRAERENGFNIEINQIHSNIVYLYLNKNYTEFGNGIGDKIIIDPTLTVSGTVYELCGEVTAYDKIDVLNNGVATICARNATEMKGYANITLGMLGNFSLSANSRIEGVGRGAGGGASCTGNSCNAVAGENGENWTVGAAGTGNNGGGGGGGERVGNADSTGGGGGGFGGTGGTGGEEAADGVQPTGGQAYGSATGEQLFGGSGSGGSAGDAGAVAGVSGGAGLRINATSGWITIFGIINMSGTNGTDGDGIDNSGSGGGSGGHVILEARNLSLSNGAKIFADGAQGGGGGAGVASDIVSH